MKRVGFYSSPRFVDHLTGAGHPERPDRIRAVYRGLFEAGMIGGDPFPEFELELGRMELGGRLVEKEVGRGEERWVEAVHGAEYVEKMRGAQGVVDQGDTVVGAGSFEVAMLGVGAVCGACDDVMRGVVERAFVAVRPPGHHAEAGRAMGFCLFGNVAIGARYLQLQHGVKRLAIVDFDVHHGNGTQACVEGDGGIWFASLHQHPRTCYPGSGFEWEIGVGEGLGKVLNVAMMPGSGDEEYLQAIRGRVVPFLEGSGAEILLISAGFDAYLEDSLAQMNVSEEGFGEMTRELVGVADRVCGGRVISVLEGGYHLRGLARGVVRHVKELGEG